jgi:hypothetical protein
LRRRRKHRRRRRRPARLPDGQPDLQGLWSFATVTPLERPKEFADRDVLTAEEAAKLEERAVRDQFVDRPPRPGDTGAYDRFWIDFGTDVIETRRTSLVVDPPDGRVPPLTPQGMEREEARAARRKIAAGPEDLPIWDRCIVGFNAGPPILPSGCNMLLYEFTIDDPTIWTRPWTVSMTMRKSDERMYEYACHEGNYGMTGILSGARAQERAGTK